MCEIQLRTAILPTAKLSGPRPGAFRTYPQLDCVVVASIVSHSSTSPHFCAPKFLRHSVFSVALFIFKPKFFTLSLGLSLILPCACAIRVVCPRFGLAGTGLQKFGWKEKCPGTVIFPLSLLRSFCPPHFYVDLHVKHARGNPVEYSQPRRWIGEFHSERTRTYTSKWRNFRVQ